MSHLSTVCRICVPVVVVTVIVIGVVNLGLVSVIINDSYVLSTENTQTSTFMCVSCKHLHQAFPHDQKLISSINGLSRKLRDGVEVCCAGNSDQMSVIIELIRHKQTNITAPMTYDPANVTAGQVSVHKRLLPMHSSGIMESFSNDSNTPLQLDNSESDSMKEHVNMVQVLPSGFLILLSGYYHVYSSLEFTARGSKPCREYGVKTWKEIVVRSRPNDRLSSGAILSSAHTCCDDCSRDKETSYTAGTFYLQAGDHLHIEVSGTGLVSFHTESTYFGLTMIGNRHQTSH